MELLESIPTFGWIRLGCMSADASDCYGEFIAECANFAHVVANLLPRGVVTAVSRDGRSRGRDIDGDDGATVVLGEPGGGEEKPECSQFQINVHGMPSSDNV